MMEKSALVNGWSGVIGYTFLSTALFVYIVLTLGNLL